MTLQAPARVRPSAVFDLHACPVSEDEQEHEAVSLILVRPIVAALREYAPSACFAELDALGIDGAAAPTLGISRACFASVLTRVAEETGDDALGLTLSEALSASHFQIIGPLVLHSASARAALRIFLELRRTLLGGPAWRVTERDGEVRVGHPVAEHHAAQIEAEFSMAFAYRTALRFWGRRAELRVELGYPEPACSERYRALFGDAVSFGHTLSCLVFPSAWLDLTRADGDPALGESLAEFARDHYRSSEPTRSWANAVRTALATARDLREASLTRLARDVGLSPRALRRRLDGEQTNFRDLRHDVQFERAERLLQNTDLTIREIASAAGFTHVKAFRRSFRSWKGAPPSSFRKRGLSQR